jgi:hypothetical protein
MFDSSKQYAHLRPPFTYHIWIAPTYSDRSFRQTDETVDKSMLPKLRLNTFRLTKCKALNRRDRRPRLRPVQGSPCFLPPLK